MNNIREALSRKEKTGGTLPVQLGRVTAKTTAKGAPYLDVEIGDSTCVATLKFWQDTQAFRVAKESGPGFYRISGEFFKGDYGLECSDPRLAAMGDVEVEEFLQGGEIGKESTKENLDFILDTVREMEVLPLKTFMGDLLGRKAVIERLVRSAAARRNHHARRGGLLAHTSSMLRVAKSVCPCYPLVVPDLVYCGVICHDLGKIVENDTGSGFVPQLSVTGELLGHINVAIEMVNRQWKESAAGTPEAFSGKHADLWRQHLLHLVASHHGTKEWGSPVTPKTPEAQLLHAIDNLDAKIEMFSDIYAAAGAEPDAAAGAGAKIYEGGRLVGGSVISPPRYLLAD
jgi:3'-5' exoribonuclease